MSRLRYARVSDRLLAGAMPFTDAHVRALAGEGVTGVLNLCEDSEYWQGERELVEAAYRRAGVAEHRLGVRDGCTVPPALLERAVALAGDGTLYVHCRGGRERSAAVCTAIISRWDGLSVDDALRRAQAANPVFRPLAGQVQGLRAWHNSSSRELLGEVGSRESAIETEDYTVSRIWGRLATEGESL